MTSPYLCLSALQTPEEVSAALAALSRVQRDLKKPVPHIPCIGFALDKKSLSASGPQSPRKVSSLKVVTDAAEAATQRGVAVSLHFDLMNRSLGEPRGARVEELFRFSEAARDVVLPLLSRLSLNSALIQLNGIPPVEDMKVLREAYPHFHYIFPVGAPLLSLAPGLLEDYIASVSPFVDYWLLDASGGAGKPFRLPEAAAFAATIVRLAPHARLAIAGGLSPTNIEARMQEIHSDAACQKLLPIRDVSFDVESGIRAAHGMDAIDYSLLESFVTNAYQALQKFC